MAISFVPLATDSNGGVDPQADQLARTAALAKLLGKDTGRESNALPYSKGAMLAMALKGGVDGLAQGLAAKAQADQQAAMGRALVTALGAGPATAPALAPSSAPITPAIPGRASSGTPLNGGARTLYDGLIQRGVQPIVAAGLIGNMSGESAFNSGAIGDRGTSYGLIQARGPRADALKRLAASQGKDWRDPDVQLDHILSELNGPENKAYRIAQQAKTPSEAAWALAQHYERPAAWALAQSGPKRAAAAEAAFRDFGGTQVSQADLPAPGARQMQANPMGDMTAPGGFFIPPADQSASAPAPAPNVTVPLPPDAGVSLPASPAPTPDFAMIGADNGTDPTADPTMFAPTPMAGMTNPLIAGPLPPSRPVDPPAWTTAQATPEQFDRQIAVAQGRTAAVAPVAPAPVSVLPPARPDFGPVPAAPSQMIAQALSRPNNGIPTDDPASAGDFARSGMGGGLGQMLGAALAGGAPAAAPVRMAQAQALDQPQAAPPIVSDAASAPAAPMPIAPQVTPQAQAVDPRRAAAISLLTTPGVPSAMQTIAAQILNPDIKTATVGDTIVDLRTGQPIYRAPKGVTSVAPGTTLFDQETRQPVFTAPKEAERTTEERNYEAAKRGGYSGSFNDFVNQRTQRQGQTVTIKNPDGSERTMFYDPVTNSLKTPEQMGAPEAPSTPNPYAPAGKLTEEQAKNTGYANRMVEGHNIINQLEQVGTSGVQQGLSRVPGAGNYLVKPETQQLLQAQRDFVNSVLRRESGAAISPSEFENAQKQYFPQPGDSPDVIAQKRRNRETTIEAVMAGAGQNYRPPESYKRPQAASPTAPASSSPTTGLPEGAQKAPDGNYYVKRDGKWFRVIQ